MAFYSWGAGVRLIAYSAREQDCKFQLHCLAAWEIIPRRSIVSCSARAGGIWKGIGQYFLGNCTQSLFAGVHPSVPCLEKTRCINKAIIWSFHSPLNHLLFSSSSTPAPHSDFPSCTYFCCEQTSPPPHKRAYVLVSLHPSLKNNALQQQEIIDFYVIDQSMRISKNKSYGCTRHSQSGQVNTNKA